MKHHKFCPTTKLYKKTINSSKPPAKQNTTVGDLPEETEHYTLALIDGEVVSVLRPEFEIKKNKIEKKKLPDSEPTE